jgi:HlyD family secretion protein
MPIKRMIFIHIKKIHPLNMRILILLFYMTSLVGCQWRDHENNDVIVLSGTLEAREVDLSFQVSGRMSDLLSDEGDLVQSGAIVAKLDERDYQLAMQQASATANASKASLAALNAGTRQQEIRAAQADLQKANAQLNYWQSEVKRISFLVPKQLTTEEQLEQTQLQYEIALAAMEQAQQRLNLLKEGARKEDIERAEQEYTARIEARELAKQQLSYTTLQSPVDGMVTLRLSEAGEVLAPGQPVIRVAELSNTWVRAYLSETDLGRVQLGQPARVKVDSYPDKDFSGTLTFISPVAEFTPKTVETRELRVDLVYRIKVQVANPDGLLKIGMPADIYLQPIADQAVAKQ